MPEVLPAEEELQEVLPADDVPTLEVADAPRPKRRKARRVIAVGKNGEVELLKNSVVIRRKGLGNLIDGAVGDREILLAFITGIEFRDVGVFVQGFGRLVKNRPGYIRILHTGSAIGSSPEYGPGSWDTVLFRAADREDFLDFKEAVEERINELHAK